MMELFEAERYKEALVKIGEVLQIESDEVGYLNLKKLLQIFESITLPLDTYALDSPKVPLDI